MADIGGVITKEWLENVLSRSGRHGPEQRIRVCSFKAKRALPKGENYVTVPVRIQVVYTVGGDEPDEKRLDLFAKLPALGKEHREMMARMGAFDREAQVYNELIPDMKRNVDLAGAPKSCYPDFPTCVYATADGPDAAVVMEDLGALGYRLGDRFTGATEVEARGVMRAFAKFHANGIEIARKLGEDFAYKRTKIEEDTTPSSGISDAPLGKDVRYSHLYTDAFDSDVVRDVFADNVVFNGMIKALRGHGEARSTDPFNQERRELTDLADRLQRYVNVTCNGAPVERFGVLGRRVAKPDFVGFRLGDCWLNNMLFRYEEQEDGTEKLARIKLLDLQILQAGPFQIDLHYFLGTSTSTAVFQKRRQLLEEEYYPELFRVLSLLKSPLSQKDYPFEEFWSDFVEQYSEYCLICAMLILPMIMASRDVVPDVDKGADLTAEDFATIGRDALESEGSEKITERFAHVARAMAEAGVI